MTVKSLRAVKVRVVRRLKRVRPIVVVQQVADAVAAHSSAGSGRFVALFLSTPNDRFLAALTGRLPDVDLRPYVVHSPDDAVTWLRSMPRPAAIVDATGRFDKLALLRATVWALPASGAYVATSRLLTTDLALACQARGGEGAAAARRRQELRESVEIQASDSRLGVIRKRGDHHFTLRHGAVEDVLLDRFGPEWGEVIAKRDAYEYESRATLVMHGEPAPREKPRTIAVPSLTVRRYADATCHVREIVTRDNLLLPDTFRHWQAQRLFHKRIIPATAWFGRLEDRIQHAVVRREPGEFFSFDSAFPTHFGHIMTETISKHWGWQIARSHNPDLRVVMTHQPGRDRLPPWKAQVLQALGVPIDDILWVTQDESVTVDSLVAAMPQLENPLYVDLGLGEAWETLYSGLGPDRLPRGRPEKIFVSRRSKAQRWCVNTPEIESFMADQGFTVIHPETMPYAEQAHAFRSAKVVAGFAGSALYNMMLNPKAKVVVLSSRSYVAANEYLMASAMGHEIHYFWAPAHLDHPVAGFSVEAYRSAWEFDLDEHRSALVEALA